MSNNKIILFSTDCPRCKVLEMKLDQAGIEYELQKDVTELIDAGIMFAPVLKVEDEYLGFMDANEWIYEKMKESKDAD